MKRTMLALLVCLSGLGCLGKPDAVRLNEPAGVTTALLVSFADRPEIELAPERVAAETAEALQRRNLQSKTLAFSTIEDVATRKRATADRLEAVAAASTEPFVLLLETRVRYYSLINGRYRWNVDLKATFAPRETLGEAQSREWEIAAFLDYDHQDHVEALEYSASAIADRVGRLADHFLSGMEAGAVTRPSTKKTSQTVTPAHPLAAGSAIYFVMVDRFHNGDPSNDGTIDLEDPHGFHGGDLRGITQKLDWLQELGVTTIWLSPVFAMRDEKFHGHGAFHGYWIEDFGAIEDRFGGATALAELQAAARARGMNVMLDMVLNHVSFDAPLVERHPEWFHNKGGITDWSDRTQILTHDVHGLPDLAQEKPEVYDHLLGNSLHWLERVQPAGFRLDAVKHVPNSFWTRYNKDVKARAGPEFVMLGEDLDGNPASVARTMREGEFDAMFDFPLHFAMVDVFCRDTHPGRLAATLFADRQYPAAVGPRREGLVTLLDNHDLPRILSACGNETGRVVDAVKFMLTARGTPSLTWGTESGASGATEPDNRADMVFVDHPIGTALRKWTRLRRENPVFTAGSDRLVLLEDDLFAYERTLGDEAALVIYNAGAPRNHTFKGTWRDVDSDRAATDELSLPRGVSVWLGKASKPPAPTTAPVRFRVEGAPAGELRIVGSGPELGDWTPSEAPAVGVVALPVGGAFAYKMVVRGKDGDVWQPGDNRFLLVSGPEDVVVRWAQ